VALVLEGLANHRGSLLGEEWEETYLNLRKKYFESLLLQRLQSLNSLSRWVEGKQQIGRVYLPQSSGRR